MDIGAPCTLHSLERVVQGDIFTFALRRQNDTNYMILTNLHGIALIDPATDGRSDAPFRAHHPPCTPCHNRPLLLSILLSMIVHHTIPILFLLVLLTKGKPRCIPPPSRS